MLNRIADCENHCDWNENGNEIMNENEILPHKDAVVARGEGCYFSVVSHKPAGVVSAWADGKHVSSRRTQINRPK